MQKLSLNSKIIFLLSIFIIGSLAVSFVGINKVGEINTSLNSLVKITAERVFIGLTMDSQTNQIRNNEKILILEETPEGIVRIGGVIDDIEKEILEHIQSYRKIASAAGIADLDMLETKLAAWKIINLDINLKPIF